MYTLDFTPEEIKNLRSALATKIKRLTGRMKCSYKYVDLCTKEYQESKQLDNLLLANGVPASELSGKSGMLREGLQQAKRNLRKAQEKKGRYEALLARLDGIYIEPEELPFDTV